jgi:hypothetical protein
MTAYTPYQQEHVTSFDAAMSIAPVAKSLRQRVLDYIVECGADGATDDEVQVATGLDSHTEVPRRIDLYRNGDVVDSGRTRLTRRGRAAVVWIAREFVVPRDCLL